MEKPVRKRMRLEKYDYSTPGAYIITTCSHNRIPLFGDIKNNTMTLSVYGDAVSVTWQKLPDNFNVQLDTFVVMPNHIHGILWLNPDGDDPVQSSLISVIKSFKALSAKRIYQLGYSQTLWQRSYYETIIRDEDHLNAAREYLKSNPMNWAKDKNYIPNNR
jgi:REP element-mobilizing transposase RayT